MSTSWAARAREPRIRIEDLLEYQETVFLICLGFTRNYSDAQELAQETWLQAQRRLDQLREPGAANAWLCRLARNLCLDHLRKRRWQRFLSLEAAPERADSETPEAVLAEGEHIRQVKAAIAKLPARMREIFVLSAYGELSYGEIAQVAGIPVGTVMSRLARARAAIRKELSR